VPEWNAAINGDKNGKKNILQAKKPWRNAKAFCFSVRKVIFLFLALPTIV
jgi:hypothetical protein